MKERGYLYRSIQVDYWQTIAVGTAISIAAGVITYLFL